MFSFSNSLVQDSTDSFLFFISVTAHQTKVNIATKDPHSHPPCRGNASTVVCNATLGPGFGMFGGLCYFV